MKLLETSSHILQLFPVTNTPYYALIDRKRPTGYLIKPLTANLALSLVADNGNDDPLIKVSFAGASIGEISASNPSQLADFLLYWKQAASSIPDYNDSLALKDTNSFSFSSPLNSPISANENDRDSFKHDLTRPQTLSDELHLKKNLIKNIAPLKHQFIYNKKLNIRCITWNLRAEPLPKANIKGLLGLSKPSNTPFDIYIIGIQESDQLGPKNLYANQNTLNATKDYITATLGGPNQYQIVAQNQLLGILSLVVCATPLIPHISGFYQNTTGTGIFGIWGNKGAALNSFYVGQDLTIGETGTEISILNCHLTHGEGLQGVERRRWELNEIQKKLRIEGLVGKRQAITVFSANTEENKPDHEIGLVDYTGEDEKESEEQQKAKSFGKVNKNLKFDLKEETPNKDPNDDQDDEKDDDDDEEDDDDDIIVSGDTDDEEEEEDNTVEDDSKSSEKIKDTKDTADKNDAKQETVKTEEPDSTKKGKNLQLDLKPIPTSSTVASLTTKLDTSSNRKITFLLGDLNYRVSLEPNVVVDLVEHKEFDTILSADKLSLEHKEKKILPLFTEGDIHFPPTYKFAVGTDDYDDSQVSGSSGSKARSPSYTDRVFYRAVDNSEPPAAFPTPKNNSSDNNTSTSVSSTSSSTASLLFPPTPSEFCKLTNYTSLMEYTLSDHKPVVADFEVDVSLIDFEKRKAAVQTVLKESDDRENSSKPNISVTPAEILVKDAIVLKQYETTIEFEYKANVKNPERVLNWEISFGPGAVDEDDAADGQFEKLQLEDQKSISSESTAFSKSENESGVFSKSSTHIPSAIDRSPHLSNTPHNLVPIYIYPRSGVLPPEGKQYIKFKCILPVSRGGKSSISRVAVLRIVDTQDIFIPVEFSALPTSLGASLEDLSHYTSGARSGTKDSLSEVSSANMPKEIWSCVDYLWQNIEEIYGGETKNIYKNIGRLSQDSSSPSGPVTLYVPPDFDQVNSGKLFFEIALQKAEPSLQFEIQEWLDTGLDFDSMVLDAANNMQDPDISSFISYYRDLLESTKKNSGGGWLSSRNKSPDENVLFANSQIKFIEAYTSGKDTPAPKNTSLLQTDKSLVGVYSVAAQFLVFLGYLDGAIIPRKYLPLVSQGRAGALLILEKLSRVNVNVLLYVMSFLKLVLDKEEEMVCMREAAERRVKKLLKRNAELASKIKSEKSKSEVINEKEAKGLESSDSGKEQSLETDKDSGSANSKPKDTPKDTKETLDSKEEKPALLPKGVSDSSNARKPSLSLSQFGTALGSVGAELNAGLNRSVSAVRKGGKEFFEETLPNVGTTVASGVENAFSGVGSNDSSTEPGDKKGFMSGFSLGTQKSASSGNGEEKKSVFESSFVDVKLDSLNLPKRDDSNGRRASFFKQSSNVSPLMDEDGRIDGKLVVNQERLNERAKRLLEFIDPFIIEKPTGFKESRTSKSERIEFMMELMGM